MENFSVGGFVLFTTLVVWVVVMYIRFQLASTSPVAEHPVENVSATDAEKRRRRLSSTTELERRMMAIATAEDAVIVGATAMVMGEQSAPPAADSSTFESSPTSSD